MESKSAFHRRLLSYFLPEDEVERVLMQPVYLAVLIRWLAWLIALGIIIIGAAPAKNLEYGGWLLAVSGGELLLMTLYLPVLRPVLSAFLERWGILKWVEGSWWPIFFDIGLALGIVYVSGGWNSPFYEFALTSLLAPSLNYGVRGAFWSALGFCVVYEGIVWMGDPGIKALYKDGHWEAGVVSTPLNPFLVAYFAAFLSELVHRLQREKAKVRDLAMREERNRLARELHDGVAQVLFMSALRLEACAERARRLISAGEEGNGNDLSVYRRKSGELACKLEEISRLVRYALWELRSAMYGVGYVFDNNLGVVEAVRKLAVEFGKASGMSVRIESEGEERGLDNRVRLAVYRVLQEALANACKHSQGREVLVGFKWAQGSVCISIQDDGVGFDPDCCQLGHGLANMKNRVEDIGGDLEIISGADQGTRVKVMIPLDEIT